MRRTMGALLALGLAAGLGYGLWTLATAAAGPELEQYEARVTPGQLATLSMGGYDIATGREGPGGYEVTLVLTARQRRALADQGIATTPWRSREGLSIHQLAAPGQDGFAVWRPYDGENGIRAELYRVAQEHPDLVKPAVIGQSVQGREIIALKVTRDAGRVPDGSRPAVLYSALQHAREWIGLEVARRLLHHVIDGDGQDPAITGLLDTRELWFVVVANPDGYQRTFDPDQRLWRKTVRDNNGDGAIDANNDGVDPNRNFDAHWNWDNEGASPNGRSETFRGTGPASEPETQAMQGLLTRVDFGFQVNYHSVAELLLYPEGWQDQTPSVDDPLFRALSGSPANSAIPGSTPMLSAGLYITNGETCDYAYDEAGTLCWTPELSDGGSGGGFVFPDDEALVQKEFENNLPFALDVARTAGHPTEPSSHLGNTIRPMYPVTFTVSYGDPQTVQVNALRRLGDVTLKWRVNEGAEQHAETREWAGGERYGVAGSVFFHKLRGTVSGARPGDRMTVWFEGGGERSEPFTYSLASDTGAPVLVVAAEDYTGTAPDYPKTDGPSHLDKYQIALDEAGLAADVYDVDARGRQAPSALGVLSHYQALVWYTGDDIVPRAVGRPAGTVDDWANDLQLAVRDYLNDGGKLLFTGKYAGTPYFGGYALSPDPAAPCDPANRSGTCEYLVDDFMQYYLSAYANLDNMGTAPDGKVRGVLPSAGGPFAGLEISLDGPTGAGNQDHSMALVPTSASLPVATFPQFASQRGGIFDNPAQAPHGGAQAVYSGYTSRAYQRLTRTLDLRGASAASLDLWLSHITAANRGFVFVEAHTPGQDDWTTLADGQGHTVETLPSNCPLLNQYPHLRHYMTQEGQGNSAKCLPSGSSGSWRAASGDSKGWLRWTVDLSAYAGKQVELSISHLANGARAGLWLDDLTLTVGDQTEVTDFEDGLGGWALAGAPEGSPANAVEARLAGAEAVPGSAIVSTADTIFFGFGFEGIGSVGDRTAVMCRAMDHLLGGSLPCAHPVEAPPALILPIGYKTR